MNKSVWCIIIVLFVPSCSGLPIPPLQPPEHLIFGRSSFQSVSDTGPIALSSVEAFRKLGFVGVFRIAIQGSATFSGNVSIKHRAQRSDTGEWSTTHFQTLSVSSSTGHAINFPTERTVHPLFLIRHEFICEFPSKGGIVVVATRGGALVKFLDQQPTEDFSVAISFAEPNEIEKKAKQSTFVTSWVSQGIDETMGKTKEYTAATDFLREAGDQLWICRRQGKLEFFCQLFSPKPEEEPELSVQSLIKMTIKRVDPLEKDKKAAPSGIAIASDKTADETINY